MIYALVKSNKVENVIKADTEFADKLSGKYDAVVRVDQLDPRPGVDWSYDGANFAPPPEPPLPEPDPVLERLKAKKGTVKDLSKAELDALIEDLITKVTGG